MAETVSEIFTEVVCAPSFEPGAVEILSRKPSIRLLECPFPVSSRVEMRPVSGGLLLQSADRHRRGRRRPVDLVAADR